MRMKMKIIRGKLMAVLLMTVVAATMIPMGLALCSDQAQAAATYSYTVYRPTVKINGHTTHVSSFTVSGLGLSGFCCQVGTDAKSGKTTVQRMSNTDIRTKLMYYYGYQKGYLGQTNKNGFMLGRALSWSSGNTKIYPATSTEVKNFINAMPSNVTVPNRFECFFCDPTNGSQNFIACKMNSPAYIRLNKTSTDAYALAAGSGYSFAGIEYTVYDSKGAVAGKLTCAANGATNTLTLDTGAYTVRETKTNQWYKLNTQTYSANLVSGQTWNITASDAPQTGTIHIKKTVNGNYDGNLSFNFRLINMANANIVYQLKTGAETGEADVQVIQGTYRCEEVLPDDAGLIDLSGPQTAEVKIGETITFERENKVLSSGVLRVSKTTNDGGPMAGFRFMITGFLFNQGKLTEKNILDEVNASVTDYDEDCYALGKWTVSSDNLERLNHDAEERKTGTRTVTLRNTLKYTGEKGLSIADIVGNLSGTESEGTITQGTLINDGGKVYKAAEDVAFEIVSAESATENGGAADTETGGEQESGQTPELNIDRERTEANLLALLSGETFSEVDTSDIDLSAEVTIGLKHVEYVYDSETPEASGYETDTNRQIKNKTPRVEENEKYRLIFNDFDWYGAATVYQEIRNGELTGNTETVITTGDDGLTNEITEGITWGRFTVAEMMTDTQKSRYRQSDSQTKEIRKQDGAAAFAFAFENRARWTGVGLVKSSEDGNVAGITFGIKGTDSRGDKIDIEAVTDSEGKIDFGNLYAGEYVVSEKDFDPERYENNYRMDGYDVPAQKLVITGDETDNITVRFDNIPLKSLYLTKVDKESQIFLKNAVFTLFEGKKQLALFRIVLDDFGRAGIDMISCDENSGIRVSTPQMSVFQEDIGEDSTETPKTDYNFAVIRGLKEGKTYTLKEITAPSGYAASIDETFVFKDGQKMVLENIAPVIETTAVDKATKDHMSDAEGMVTIVDTVSFRNLGPGHRYLISGVLANKPVGERTPEELEQDAEVIEIIKDANGKEVTAQKEFVPKSENGTVDISFTFDASLLDGKQVVAMEQLVDPALTGVNGVITVVASHEDMEDESQSIFFPAIGTKASAGDTGKRITQADGEVMITDTVEYSNVIAGKIYTMTGTLMDKETGAPLQSGGTAITASVQFRAEKDGPVFAAEGEELTEEQSEGLELVSGTLELKFTFDGLGIAGKQAVVFEKLTTDDGLVGEHSDLNDEEQTIYLPSISTAASTNGTDKVSDKVTFKNLLPGEAYVMKGVLMDKSTGEELLLNGKTVAAEMDFVPQEKDGEVRIDFPVDVQELQGKTAVVFETCYLAATEGAAEVELISHRDINNKAQTVTFDVLQTGQHAPWKMLFPSGLLAATAVYVLRRTRTGGGLW